MKSNYARATKEIKDILNEITDIIPLEVFLIDDVDQKLDSADKKRDDTIHKLGNLDYPENPSFKCGY
ncbi:T7SS effector LXG polymorphic toxin [Bacillus atrophaeus]|uniref:T7SS effector LXG polymorphic toxin n=1 Tax=Bacillus atrophaeus TaxID=1452 RepID=UPI003CC6559D